jgi:hypothetical protein
VRKKRVKYRLPKGSTCSGVKRDRARLARALQPAGADGVPERLRTIETIHLSAARRALQKPELRPERFTAWTVVPRLASELAALGAVEADELQSDLRTSADLAIGSLDRIREQRRHNVERWVQQLSPVAAISVLVGIYSALTAVPAPSQHGLVVAIPDALAVTAVLVVAGVVVGLVVDWALNTWRRDL